MTKMTTVVPVGDNRTLFWGITMAERTRRIARMHGLGHADAVPAAGGALLVDDGFALDPAWVRHFAQRAGEGLTLGGRPVIAHCRDAAECAAIQDAMRADGPPPPDTRLSFTAHERGGAITNAALRKREQPFALPLTPATLTQAERASYFGAYKGVTDLLTKYLWPEWALVLTRLCARAGITPNMVTSLGAILCVTATILFGYGHYWGGMAAALGFMVLDTVDGKLARCTITSSKLGNIFDHGIDLVHPPFWWYAWGLGLVPYGRPLAPDMFRWAMGVIIVGYVAQRVIEGAFMRRYGGIHIHVWRKIDSDFRLVTARRNPNMVILFAAMLVGRPDIGLLLVAWWTVISCLFHLVRLLQATGAERRGAEIRSWLG